MPLEDPNEMEGPRPYRGPSQQTRWKNCLVEGSLPGFATGFMVGGAMAFIGTGIFALTPQMRGQRMKFLLGRGVTATLAGGSGFGSMLAIGG
eukprot:CAMPEP_0117432794 /NCGR_PEP_ID=MMETSP0758-20121206/12229_1 /TAXON_ID=63605 /ORGANISM="Percolomonas cosmopolitus, Strain AE-1 (ATCC 50343)" /LENGTH=91 /DNA_ID=CAMNT_0005222961 /DNA_START=1 /DNA_END=272 /DNA_ORIENTATION=+